MGYIGIYGYPMVPIIYIYIHMYTHTYSQLNMICWICRNMGVLTNNTGDEYIQCYIYDIYIYDICIYYIYIYIHVIGLTGEIDGSNELRS